MRVQSLILAVVAFIAAALPAQTPPVAWKCPGNLVTNGGFNSNTVIVGDGSMPASHTDAWTAAYNTPQLQSGTGCHDPYYVSMWGNQAVGEAIQQPVTFQAGHTYAINFCARFQPSAGKPNPYVNIVLRGSTAKLTDPSCPAATCDTIMTTPNITSTAWNTFTSCWTPARNESWLTISASNGSNAKDGAQTSFGNVDDVCITEVVPPVIEGPKDTCISPATYCAKAPATGPFGWSVDHGTFQPANSDGSCILVTWNPPQGGAVHLTSVVNGCKINSDLKLPECTHPPCCRDVKASLVTSELVSGGAALTFALSGPSTPATTVRATVLAASHVQSTSCGTSGPIAATASPTQPPTGPPGWNPPVAPYLSGSQVVWQSIPTGGSALGSFVMNLQLPPTGSFKCNDEVTVCIEFEVTFAAANGQPCRTCTFIQCFTFKRCPACQ